MMLIATRILTVNPAFFEEIKADNRRLHELVDELRGLVEAFPPRAARPERLPALLAELRDQLALHFAAEEAFGYFEDPARDVDPQFCDGAEALREEHAVLCAQIGELAEQADNLLHAERHHARGIGFSAAAKACRYFIYELEAHEERERQLIWQAYLLDIGGEG